MTEDADVKRANNPPPLARAIQMPMGDAQGAPWANAVLNGYRQTRDTDHG